jgi:putative toxin-antitoxin system antitoxin component (TIGR02293 family)
MEKIRGQRVDSTGSRELERGKDVVHFEAEVIQKAGDTEIRGQAIAKKVAAKDIAKGVSVPVTAEAKLAMTVDPIIERIVEVMGNREQAMRWLGTPVRALDFATPISMMATSSGKKRVLDVLGQMEHGVW